MHWYLYALSLCYTPILISALFLYKRWENAVFPLFQLTYVQSKTYPSQSFGVVWESAEGTSYEVVIIGVLGGAALWCLAWAFIDYYYEQRLSSNTLPHWLTGLLYFGHGIFVGLLYWEVAHAAGLVLLGDLLVLFAIVTSSYFITGVFEIYQDVDQENNSSEKNTLMDKNHLIVAGLLICPMVGALVTIAHGIIYQTIIISTNEAMPTGLLLSWISCLLVLTGGFYVPSLVRLIDRLVSVGSVIGVILHPLVRVTWCQVILWGMALVSYIHASALIK